MTAFRKPVGLPPLKEVKTDRRIAEDGGAVAAVAVAVGGLLDRPGLHHYMGMVRPSVRMLDGLDMHMDVWQEWKVLPQSPSLHRI